MTDPSNTATPETVEALRAALGLTGAAFRSWSVDRMIQSAIRHIRNNDAFTEKIREALRAKDGL